MTTAVALHGVSYTYPGARAPALRDITLEIGHGELVVLAGGSGSGKSTLLRVVSGLVPHFHGGTFAGQAIVAGMDTREHGPGELAEAVGTLFQDPETQVVTGTVRAELAFGLENRGLRPPEVARGVEEAALALAIDQLLERSTAELSGGELQRVALGAALAVALAAGFAWYERERPDARIVALVGTLAAFAALGRIAFAAVPNVKPTTDIVLIAGYALGGAPGFAVGALAALTSNFFFGQGPWTPWQMAGWAATGVAGAWLAWGMRTHGRRLEAPPLGRWPLAIVCGVAGFAFTVLQDVGDWVSFSDHSLAQLGVYVGQGLGFDAVHAAGCVAFALALGPALTRSIQRFARRTKVDWVPLERAAVPVLLAAMMLGTLGVVGSRPQTARAAASVSPSSVTAAAANYLLGSENADGGFGPAPRQPSDQLYTGWAALGLAAAGHDLNRIGDARGLMDYVRAGAGTHDVGALERTILVVRAAGLSARAFGGRDLIAALEGHLRADGSISGQVNLTAFGVLALRADGIRAPARTRRWLIRQQNRDGGFGFAGAGGASDVDDTGASLEALAGDPAAAGVRTRAVAFLRRQQNHDGGFPSQPGMDSNAQSTAWAIQGLDAAGVGATGLHRGGAMSPLAYLDSLLAPGGAVRYARGVSQTPVWVTGEALMAMAGKPLPVPAPAPPAAPQARSAPAAASPTHRAAGPTTHQSAAASAPAKRAPRHTTAGARRRAAPRDERAALIHRNQVLAGDFAEAAGMVTALALAPVGLG